MALTDKTTKVLVQGITGKEGQRGTVSMIGSGTTVSCGVTPGKGGQEVEGKPVFNSVQEALTHDPDITLSVLYVPPLFLLGAAMEAMEAGIKQLLIFTENVPVQDTAKILEYARANNVRVFGPSSVGICNTRIGSVGSIGFPGEGSAFSVGNIAIISKSGGMTAETARILTAEGIGQSTCIGIGGDVLLGTTFTDLLEELDEDPHTSAIVVFGEFGGTYEEQLAEAVSEGKVRKPVIAFISGIFAETIGRSIAMGHAGAIIEHGAGTAQQKKTLLKNAGVHVADYHYEIPKLVREALK